MASQPARPNSRHGFEIAIVCALPLEADAVEALFDRRWDDEGPPFDKASGDRNTYSTGVIGRHNIVLVHMPRMGKVNAATTASSCAMSFPNIKLALVVGICGAVPFKSSGEEIVLGDVIISNGVIQYDFGWQLPGYFVRKDALLDSLGRPNQEILGVLAKLASLRGRQEMRRQTTDYLIDLRREPELDAEYPGVAKDILFEPSYRHTEEPKSCEQLGCSGELVPRRRLGRAVADPAPAVHVGIMASGDSVMMSGEDRDRIAAAEDIIAFEMEGAGVWGSFPCVVIKGACDYADSHKNRVWQRYAAATAAACAKAFLSFWVPSLVQDVSCLASNFETSLSLQNQGSLDRDKAIRAPGEAQRQPVFSVPFLENKHFVGREETLAKLQSLLFEKEEYNVALVGLGGIGKTQLALKLAYWVKKTKPDYSVLWMPALSPASFEQACMQIAKAYGIETANGADVKESVRQYLSSKSAGKWLLIVDNADDAQTVMGSAGVENGIHRFLPQSYEGRILFTTRVRKIAVDVAQRNIVEVPAMLPDEARRYFEEALIQEVREDALSGDQATNELLASLTYLPLAITQVAAYLNVNQMSITEYLNLFKSTDNDKTELLNDKFRDSTRYEDSQDTVITTWLISFRQVEKADEFASHILMFLALIEPRAIPRSMLPKGKSQQQLTRAIGTLCGYGFLSKRGAGGEMFDMHSLVHLTTTFWIQNHKDEEEQRQAAITHLAEVFPTCEWENRDIWRLYLPHAVRLLLGSADSESEEMCRLEYQVAQCVHVDGRMAEAMAMLENVVRIRETLSESHPDRLASQHALAGAYLTNGQIKKAVDLLEHVVRIREEIFSESHPSRLASQHELAAAYLANGQIKKAVDLLEHVVRIGEEIFSDDQLYRLASQHELARAYQANGQIEKAVELLEHVVRIREETLSKSHLDRLISQHELAGAYHANGQVKKAIELLEHVVRIGEETLSESHPFRLASQHALAREYQANGQIEKAVELLEHVVRIREETLSESHPSRLASQHELAGAYDANGQVRKAVNLLEHVVRIREETLSESHPDRLASQHELAISYQANGQVEKAVELLEHVVRIREEILSESHPDRLASQHELARAYYTNGQIEKAVELLEHIVRIRKTLSESHPSRLASQHALAGAYLTNGQIKKALDLLEHVVRIREEILSESHPDRLASQHELARAYQANGQVRKAANLLEHVVSINKEVRGETHPARLVSEKTLRYFQEILDSSANSTN